MRRSSVLLFGSWFLLLCCFCSHYAQLSFFVCATRVIILLVHVGVGGCSPAQSSVAPVRRAHTLPYRYVHVRSVVTVATAHADEYESWEFCERIPMTRTHRVCLVRCYITRNWYTKNQRAPPIFASRSIITFRPPVIQTSANVVPWHEVGIGC